MRSSRAETSSYNRMWPPRDLERDQTDRLQVHRRADADVENHIFRPAKERQGPHKMKEVLQMHSRKGVYGSRLAWRGLGFESWSGYWRPVPFVSHDRRLASGILDAFACADAFFWMICTLTPGQRRPTRNAAAFLSSKCPMNTPRR